MTEILADHSAALSCLSMPLAENLRAESEHSFRCFELEGQLLRIREEMSSEDMPTGGRLWDAGTFKYVQVWGLVSRSLLHATLVHLMFFKAVRHCLGSLVGSKRQPREV